MRLHEIVTEFIDEDLIARVDRATRDDLVALVLVEERHLEILLERLGRRVDEETLPLANDLRESEKERDLLRPELDDAIVFPRNDVDVIAAEHEKLGDLPDDIRLAGIRRIACQIPAILAFFIGVLLLDRDLIFIREEGSMPNDAVQRRLHGTGRDFEWLEKIGADADRDHDRDQDHFYVLAPAGVAPCRHVFRIKIVETLGLLLDRFFVLVAQTLAQFLDLRFQVRDGDFAENVLAIAQQFLRVANEEMTVFDVARIEHESYCARKTWMKASCGMLILPMLFMRFLPSFCFSSNFRFRVMSPP